jgi:hypothetical protein
MTVDVSHTSISGGTGNVMLAIGNMLPSNTVVTSTRIMVTQAFNGSAPTLSVGSYVSSSSLMTTSDNDLTGVGLVFKPQYYDAGVNTDTRSLSYTLTLSAATTGAAKIMIEYYTV